MGIQVISFHCTLKNRLGQVISSTENHDVVTQSASPNDILHALAEGLKDLRKGESRRICLRADQAYGFYDPGKIVSRHIEKISNGDRLKVGDEVGLRMPNGTLQGHRVTEIMGGVAMLDGNHPLAGQDLIFEIETYDAREATPAEIAELVEVPKVHSTYH